MPNIIDDRKEEVTAIDTLIENIRAEDIIPIPSDARVEGGDVMLCDDFIFVGYSEETDFLNIKWQELTEAQLIFYSILFSQEVKVLNSENQMTAKIMPYIWIVVFSLLVTTMLLYTSGFKNQSDVDFLISHFGEDNIIFISRDEMYQMNSNIFSISPQVVISEKGFED